MAEMPVIELDVAEILSERWGIWDTSLSAWKCHSGGAPWVWGFDEHSKAVAFAESHYLNFEVEVRPYPAPSACPDCGAAPCDCGEEIWTYWWRHHDSRPIPNEPTQRRADAVNERSGDERRYQIQLGPIQRITDPPHRFEEAKAETPTLHGVPLVALCGGCQYPLSKCQCNSGRLPTFTAASLARALFDVEMEEEAEQRSEWEAADMSRDEGLEIGLRRVLDIMWSKTKPDVRQRCERLAAKVCVRMGRR